MAAASASATPSPPPDSRDSAAVASSKVPPDSRDSAAVASPQVCLFSTCEPMSLRGKRYHDVYVFDLDPNFRNRNLQFPNPDLDDPDLISVSPALRFECDYFVARCIVNSTLYLFEGSASCDPHENSVHTFDLSSASSSSSSVELRVGVEPKVVAIADMETCPPMNGLKCFPHAMLTPDGTNILVFSKTIVQFNPKCPDGREFFKNFELYDHAAKKWVVLPPFPRFPYHGIEESLTIGAYYFVDESTFVIRLEAEYCSYALHLNGGQDGEGEWKIYRGSNVPLHGEVTVLGGGVCVSRLCMYNRLLEKFYYGRFSRCPSSVLEEDVEEERFDIFMIAVGHGSSNDEDGVVNICVVYVEFDAEFGSTMDRNCTTTYPRVYIDLHELSLAEMNTADDDGVPKFAPTKTTSYKFDISIPCWTFWPAEVLPVS